MNSSGPATTGIVWQPEQLLVTSLSVVRRHQVETASTSGAAFRIWLTSVFRLLKLHRTEVLWLQNMSELVAGSSFLLLRSNSFTRWVIRTSTSRQTASPISRRFDSSTRAA